MVYGNHPIRDWIEPLFLSISESFKILPSVCHLLDDINRLVD